MKKNIELTRCEKGHYYDASKFDKCPHCDNKHTPEKTTWKPLIKNAKKEDSNSDN